MNSTTKFSVNEIIDSVFIFTFKTRADMGLTFLRFQEYYESPKFKGKAFSLDEYAAWYQEENGAFTYHEDWDGMNVPSYVFKPFFDGEFKTNKLEQQFLNVIKPFYDSKKPFYVIGVNTENKDQDHLDLDIKHELSHALYYTNAKYKNEVDVILKNMDVDFYNKMKNCIIDESGYHEDVIHDEIHAYTLEKYYIDNDDNNLFDSNEKKLIQDYGDNLDEIYLRCFN
jgi:hypothetical protein